MVETSSTTNSARVDILQLLSRATLDIIGLAGFNYDFNSLQHGEEGTELSAAFYRSNSPKELPVFLFLKGFIPPLRIIEWDNQARQTKIMWKLLRRIGLQLIEEKQKAVLEEKASAGGTVIEKKGTL
jgi:hypothetical protein